MWERRNEIYTDRQIEKIPDTIRQDSSRQYTGMNGEQTDKDITRIKVTAEWVEETRKDVVKVEK